MAINVSFSKKSYKSVGKRPIRHDGLDKVTGKALFGADIQLPGLIYGKVLRSPHAHARIKSINTTKAESHPSVKAVATFRDLPSVSDKMADLGESSINYKYLSNNVLAEDKVLYKGHPVAAVAASSVHVAEEALDLIEVDYEVLPSVTNAEDAMKPDAPILHEEMVTGVVLGDDTPKGTNVASHTQHKSGDVEKAFKDAYLVVEREFRTKTVHQGYIEPQNGTAWWGNDGRLTIWCSSQGQFVIRDETATVLDMPVSDIKVVPMEIGGGFGGKLRVYLEPLAAVLSKKSGRPVKMTMTRAEVLEATGPASGGYMKVKIGVTEEGRMTAAQTYFAFEGGAYPGAPIGGAAACAFAAYNIENILVDGYDIVDNKPPTMAYRAPGSPNITFGIERVVYEICEKLNIDHAEFRILNVAKTGDRKADGTIHGSIGALETLEAVKAHPHYSAPLNGENTGRGLAIGFWMNGSGAACVVANLHTDGKITLVEGSADIGGTRTSVSQQFAEVLGIPVEDIQPQVADTDSIGFTSGTGGSGATFKSGLAAYEAAHDMKSQLVERAAILWETTPDQIDYSDGVMQLKNNSALSLTFKELADKVITLGGPVVGSANINPGGSAGAFNATIVDLEVDPETGKVNILRYTALQDAGVAIHPGYVEGQIQGGAVQGIGWALNEEYFMSDDGKMLNSSFLDYRMPTSLDLPMIDAVIVEVPNPNHPFGVRGVGEVGIVPPMAAIANAISDAVGVNMNELPMNPRAILSAMTEE